MGGTESKPDQSSRQQQSNHNDIIDQSTGAAWLQLNWASFGGGISSILIIGVLIVLLYFCWRQNRRANAKARRAELHELLAIAGRRGALHGPHRHRDSSPPPRPPPYPGLPSSSSVSGGFPGSPPAPIHRYPGPQYDGPIATIAGSLPFYGGMPSGIPAISYHGGQVPILSGLPQLAAHPEWTSRIREITGPAPRPRVRYSPATTQVEAEDTIQLDTGSTTSILRTPRSNRRSMGSGLSRSASLRSVHEAEVPRTPRTGLDSLVDQLEAEENARDQF